MRAFTWLGEIFSVADLNLSRPQKFLRKLIHGRGEQGFFFLLVTPKWLSYANEQSVVSYF